jgi:hypothetical protein
MWRGQAAPLAPIEHENNYAYEPTSGHLSTVTGPAHLVTNNYETTRDVLSTKVNSRVSDGSAISSIDYTVNALGQRTNATRSGAATNSSAWSYDALGQVATADDSNNAADRAYEHDQIGNSINDSVQAPR